MSIDTLAVVVFPSEIFLNSYGTLMVQKANGKSIGVLELTKDSVFNENMDNGDELDFNKILDLDYNENLRLDNLFYDNVLRSQIKIIERIRALQPKVIINSSCYSSTLDNGFSAKLVDEAISLAGSKSIITTNKGNAQNVWLPDMTLYCTDDINCSSNFVVDITAFMGQKLSAIKSINQSSLIAYDNEGAHFESLANNVIEKAKELGSRSGFYFAEGFTFDSSFNAPTFE